MKIPEDTIAHLQSMGIEVQIANIDRAVDLFKEFQKDRVVIAALHLTC